MKSDKEKIFTPLVKILIILLFSSITINIVIFGDFNEAKKVYEMSAREYYKRLKELEQREDNNKIEMENKFEEYYSDRLKKLIDEEALVYLAQQQWNYILTINGQDFNSGLMYTEDTNIKIVLAEFHSKDEILPKDILIKGTLTGEDANDSLKAHMKIYSPVDVIEYIEEDEYGKRVCYELKNISKGSLITLKLSEMLKYRMNLQDKIKGNEMEIVVR